MSDYEGGFGYKGGKKLTDLLRVIHLLAAINPFHDEVQNYGCYAGENMCALMKT